MTWQFPCPNIQSDATFLANRDDGFGNDNVKRKRAHALARAAGVNPTGKIYCPSLCPPGEPFSPKAWISDKSDIKRICRKNNWDCPDMGVKAHSVESEPKPYQVADSLVEEEVQKRVAAANGNVTPRERLDMKHEIAERARGTMT
uniref:Uncharacterized protein n=2 Tax=viral metagenome TaxID=1070528 RepID=A0A6M3IN53_9ZZZZ